MMLRKSALLLLMFGALVVLPSCSSIKPWVKPYERQNIADPLMSFDRDPVADSYITHVHDAREGARGADGGAGGGCGCN